MRGAGGAWWRGRHLELEQPVLHGVDALQGAFAGALRARSLLLLLPRQALGFRLRRLLLRRRAGRLLLFRLGARVGFVELLDDRLDDIGGASVGGLSGRQEAPREVAQRVARREDEVRQRLGAAVGTGGAEEGDAPSSLCMVLSTMRATSASFS